MCFKMGSFGTSNWITRWVQGWKFKTHSFFPPPLQGGLSMASWSLLLQLLKTRHTHVQKKKCKPAFQTQTPVPSPGSRRGGWWPQPFCCFNRHSRQDPWLQEEEGGGWQQDRLAGWLWNPAWQPDSPSPSRHLAARSPALPLHRWNSQPSKSVGSTSVDQPPMDWKYLEKKITLLLTHAM